MNQKCIVFLGIQVAQLDERAVDDFGHEGNEKEKLSAYH